MNLFGGLLFLQGHITNVELARQLAGADTVDGDADDEPQVAAMTASDAKGATPGAATDVENGLRRCRAMP